MAPEGGGPALHDGTPGTPDVGGQGMGAFVRRIARAENVLQGQQSHVVPQQNDGQNGSRFVL
jgi:hypothetical protein